MSQMLEELKCILSFLDVYKFTLHVQKIFWETIQAVPLIFVFGSFANMSYTVQWSKAWLTSALLNVKEFCLNRIVFTSKSGNDKLNPCFFYYFLSFNHVGSEVPSQNVPPTGALCTKLTRVLYLRLKLKFSFLSCLFFFFRRLATGRKYLAPVHFLGQSKANGAFSFSELLPTTLARFGLWLVLFDVFRLIVALNFKSANSNKPEHANWNRSLLIQT